MPANIHVLLLFWTSPNPNKPGELLMTKSPWILSYIHRTSLGIKKYESTHFKATCEKCGHAKWKT
jgi:hypothetical protein